MNRTAKRNGFTLVEILIVVGIIVLVSAIFVPVILNLTDRNQVPKGASLLENALSLAKSRAVAEKRANGIRLIASQPGLRNTANNLGFAWYDEIQYIEDPSDFNEHWVWGIADAGLVDVEQPWWSIAPSTGPAAPSPGSLPWGFDTITVAPGPFAFTALIDSGTTTQVRNVARNFLLFSPITFTTWRGNGPYPLPYINPITGMPGTVTAANVYRSQRFMFNFSVGNPYAVQVGDSVEILGTGEIYRVVSVSTGAVAISAHPTNPANPANVSVLELDRPLTRNVLPSRSGRPNYRVIRQPRVIPALEPIRLPRDVIIDLTPSRVPLLGLGADVDNPGASIFMSGVSTGIGVSNISGLTIPAGAPQQVAPLYVDIMFSPSGEVMPTSQTFGNSGTGPFGQFSVGASGLIALWVHQRGDPNLWAARQITAAQGNADNQALVAINTRTGFIGSYPINLKPGPSGVDPLYNARAGKERISADTGP